LKGKGFVDYSRVLVLIAALNEEEGIGPTLSELKRTLDRPTFLIVDGNSTDKTAEVARLMGAEVIVQEGRGKGDAIRQAIMHVADDGVKYVVFVDADYTYPAGYLPEMIKVLNENPRVGMVCGNRFRGDLNLGRLHDLLYFGNRLLAFAHNFLNGVELDDPLTGLRVVRWEILRDWKPKSKGFDVEVELNHQVERKGFDIVEMPIDYRPRLGEKKLRLEHGLTILKRIVSESLTLS
jgi:glycosyltransferase involved in cell wall biosynthesis